MTKQPALNSPIDPPFSTAQRVVVQDKLLEWYDAHRRDLPWRQTRDPYRILVAEIMLQQTQVDRVIPKYHEFLERFPDARALAAALVGDVIRTWVPLGYNRRAVRLHTIARQITDRFGGEIPDDPNILLTLDGIGPYTAAAIAAFAFDQPLAAVDTNLRRVIGRFLRGNPEAPLEWARKVGARLVSPERPGDWNQAMMDLGATICVARRPACLLCPLRPACAFLALPNEVRESTLDWQTSAKPVRKSNEPFVGSNRYFRGRIVDYLRALPPGHSATLADLASSIAPDRDPLGDWVKTLLEALATDGLIVVEGEPPNIRARLP